MKRRTLAVLVTAGLAVATIALLLDIFARQTVQRFPLFSAVMTTILTVPAGALLAYYVIEYEQQKRDLQRRKRLRAYYMHNLLDSLNPRGRGPGPYVIDGWRKRGSVFSSEPPPLWSQLLGPQMQGLASVDLDDTVLLIWLRGTLGSVDAHVTSSADWRALVSGEDRKKQIPDFVNTEFLYFSAMDEVMGLLAKALAVSREDLVNASNTFDHARKTNPEYVAEWEQREIERMARCGVRLEKQMGRLLIAPASRY